ncbi:MAG TPA: helix-turn-helix transcriptional regulator [Planctomycetota bacterium]|jgi:DNA-binding XRE family transcriptional regulator|nr:helix-turn-helix transcriptional regulator [Planctomycetota bacterium]
MAAKRKPTRDGLEILHRRFYEGRPDRIAALEEARATAAVARRVFDLREGAGLSRRELARVAGTSATEIRRLEEDDYDGESLEMLKKIAHALNQRVDIRLLPFRRKRKLA